MSSTPGPGALFAGRHPSHRQTLAKHLPLLLLMALTVVLFRFVEFETFPVRMSTGTHAVLEVLAVVIAMLIFAIGWTSHRRRSSPSLLVLSCLFLGVGILDFSHMMSYQGMPDYVTPAGPEKAILFWLAARLLAALALLWIAVAPGDLGQESDRPYLVLLVVLAVVALVHLLIFNFSHWLPATYREGQGLTPAKIGFEYGLIVLNLLAAAALWRRMRGPLTMHAATLFAALVTTALSGLCFTFYLSVHDQMNLLGHLLKAGAYLFLFKAIFVDTIERPYAEAEATGQRLSAIFDVMPDMLLEVDGKGRVIEFHAPNDPDVTISPGRMLGRDLIPLLSPAALSLCQRTFAEARERGAAQSAAFTVDLRGSRRWFQLSVATKGAPSSADMHYVVIARDVTKSKEQEVEILRLAQYDSLTGLPNRKLFQQRTDMALGLLDRSGGHLALLFIDLDHFKNINDTLGHQNGDEMLKALAERLRANLRPEDTLSRQGGDEFLMALPGLDSVAAAHMAEQILHSIVRPVAFGDHVASTSASIGIAIFPEDGRNYDELSRRADAAMYQAKQDGRNTYRFFTGELQMRMSRVLALENSLRMANDNLELSLRYQPQWSIDGRQVTGMEALLRWNHPTLGDVNAAEFIPVAEASGQILALNDWVLNQALAQIKRWLDEGVSPAPVAVNLSMIEFRRGDLAKHIRRCLSAWNISPALLQLEITEAMLMEDPDAAAVQLEQLSALGVRIMIDDFGTCYSSLLQVKRFHATAIKIDRSFIEDLEHDQDKRDIVESLVKLAHKLGLDTLAEGVETAAQLEVLRDHGCRYVQGYYLGHPVDPARLGELLKATEPERSATDAKGQELRATRT
ncbi:bifunctional diguanylate cyclase/phosphodiesterase [Pseudomonas sp.]|uniref:bifunctional diguanylate cyclase/phosphodiesterase n=1 Tax=Pseudomonas sp. TaxID=306 RepID=UPI002729ECDB|nr:EAL domain-containing protein [Pseudomonas sp.]